VIRFGRNDGGFVRKREQQRQRQQQIPPLRCGMTNKRTRNDNGKCNDKGNGNDNGNGNDSGKCTSRYSAIPPLRAKAARRGPRFGEE
jgi:hypothetical protein